MNTGDIAQIEKAARAGGDVLRKYFGENLEQTTKGVLADIKTKADEESEEAIYNSLKDDFPQAGFHLEERGELGSERELKFVVDPLDGTNNFVLGIPNFTVSIALYEKEKIKTGVIFNPVLNRMCSATLGGGATMNGQKIGISKVNEISQSTVAYMCNYVNSSDYQSDVFKRLNEFEVKRVLNNWSVASDFCLLAEGKIEVVINNNTDVYDFSAGKLIAKEAGAKITTFKGETEKEDKNSIFLVSNGTKIHDEIINFL